MKTIISKDMAKYQEMGWWDPEFNCMACGLLKEIKMADARMKELYDDTKYTRNVQSGTSSPQFHGHYKVYSYCSKDCMRKDEKAVNGELVTKSTGRLIFG